MRRTTLATVLITAALLAGCTGATTADNGDTPTTGQDTGTFTLYISDQPVNISRFDSLDVTVSEARVFRQVNNTSTPETLQVNATVDITQLVGSKAAEIVTAELATGTYTKIELEASSISGVVDGSDVQVKLPSGKLMLNKQFTIEPNSTVEFVFDIHVVKRGRGNGYLLRPVIAKSGVVGEDVEPPEVPEEANGNEAGDDEAPAEVSCDQVESETHTVSYSDSGFSPAEITIDRCDTVVWQSDGATMWVASDQHPIHSGYDGTTLDQHCTNGESDTFDQCEEGPVYNFTFTKTGTWGYHNHRLSGHTGTVIVEER